MAPGRMRPGSIKGATQLRSSHDGDIEDLGFRCGFDISTDHGPIDGLKKGWQKISKDG